MSRAREAPAVEQAQPGEVAAAEGAARVPPLTAIMAAVFMVAAEARVIAPLLPALAGEFETTVARAGLLITAYSIPYGLFQLVFGPLADRFSRQRVIGAALGLFAVGTFVSAFAPNILALDLLRFCTGAAGAGVIPVALAYVGDAVAYEERQAALGRVVSIASLGGVLSASMGGIIATVLSWRAIFFAYGILALLVAVLLLRLPVVRARPSAPVRGGLLAPYVGIFQRAGRRALALYLLVFFEGFAATSTVGYLGAFLFERDRLNYATIGLLLTLSGIASIATGRLIGPLVIRLGERGMLLTGGSLMAVSYIAAGLRPMPIFFPLAMLMAGAGFPIAHSTLQARATEIVPDMRGTAVALFAFSLFLGGGLGTWVAGMGIDRWGFGVTLPATAVALLVFTAVSWPVMRLVRGGSAAGDDT